MFGVKSERFDVNVPVPVPSIVFEFAIVGLVLVFQQIPLAVIFESPSFETVPEQTAEIVVKDVIGFVVTDAKVEFVSESSLEHDTKSEITTKSEVKYFFIIGRFSIKTLKK